METKSYHLYTDGACSPNPGTGGWSFILCLDDKEIISKNGSCCNSTNNRMELTAVLEGMEYFFSNTWKGTEKLIIVSDSKYLINGIESWCEKWERKKWLKHDGKQVLNPDLWQKILSLKNTIRPTCEHVKGHNGHKWNEKADELARQASKKTTP